MSELDLAISRTEALVRVLDDLLDHADPASESLVLGTGDGRVLDHICLLRPDRRAVAFDRRQRIPSVMIPPNATTVFSNPISWISTYLSLPRRGAPVFDLLFVNDEFLDREDGQIIRALLSLSVREETPCWLVVNRLVAEIVGTQLPDDCTSITEHDWQVHLVRNPDWLSP